MSTQRARLALFTPLLQSIPSVPYLEKEFKCHALHLPMGQSSVSYSLPFRHFLSRVEQLHRIKPIYPMKESLSRISTKAKLSLNAFC